VVRVGRFTILLVALGAGVTGYFLGGLRGPEATTSRLPPPAPPRYEFPDEAIEPPVPADEQIAAVETAAAVLAEDLPAPDELMDALQRSPQGDKAQILLIGMVANAASRGPAALPAIQELLRSGVDMQFPEWDGKGLGYPSLRVALMAAAEATGDPAAAQLVAEVARTSENPVEVVFGAHILDRLQVLDAPTAQRALDALGKPLTKDQMRAMGSIGGRVVAAAAAADPAYAENYLLTQLRMPKGQGADPRFVAPVLDGIPAKRAQDLVVASLTAADVSDGAKRMLAGRAATRAELPMLTELQHGIEAGIYSKPVASAIAQSAVGNRAYRQIERQARHALKAGDLDKARALATDYHQWIATTQQTIDAAQRMGAPLKKELPTYMKLQQQRLDTIRNQIAKALKQQQQAAAAK
jgi:hypothetical protein